MNIYFLTIWKRTLVGWILVYQGARAAEDSFQAARDIARTFALEDWEWQSRGPAKENRPTKYVIRSVAE